MVLRRTLIENKDKVVLAPASSAYKHALKEVLAAPGVASRIKNTKAAREVEALQVGREAEVLHGGREGGGTAGGPACLPLGGVRLRLPPFTRGALHLQEGVEAGAVLPTFMLLSVFLGCFHYHV